AIPVMAQVAKETGALTVGVVTKPFSFEGKKRQASAERGIAELRKYVDALIIIPNDRLKDVANKDTTLESAFALADAVLTDGVKGISDLITNTGMINLDFADVRTIMVNAGTALMGMGVGQGQDKAKDAALMAISSPLLETKINGAKGILVNITGGRDLTLSDVDTAMNIIKETVDENCEVIFGTVTNDELSDELKITVIATGFGENINYSTEQNHQVHKIFETQVRQEPIVKEIMMSNIPPAPPKEEEEDYNIPAFLRRK
ncbi:cell division protein FtsZ, partial [Candidatus Riflebacteria bacterium]